MNHISVMSCLICFKTIKKKIKKIHITKSFREKLKETRLFLSEIDKEDWVCNPCYQKYDFLYSYFYQNLKKIILNFLLLELLSNIM
jgi:hypothetical protein